jgi:putative oxygen-independent coproporphyrinogen III oxidase
MAALGVYIHIPFCASRCDYCAFATWTDRGHLIDEYLDAVRTDIAATMTRDGATATTVFVGGGTPSLVPAPGLARVLDAVERVPGAEVTVECNPETVTPELLATYREAGVTRLSFGVQSMVASVLDALGRAHTPGTVEQAVAWARDAGFETFNLDIIYGGATESIDDWARTLDRVLALDPPHISAYGLTVEPGTPLALDPARHPDDDDQADKYLLATARFAAAGLTWYEISNWARPGHECRHNELYWDQGDYLAFGCAAHGHRGGERYWNVRTPERYVDAITAGRSPVGGSEVLDAETRRLEGLQLSLRTRTGVPAGALPLEDPDALLDPLVEVRDGRAVLTVDGRLLANEVALRLR